MSSEVTLRVRISDDDHIWINGKQFISFNRIAKIRTELTEEAKDMQNELKRLHDENKALKVLLQDKLKECD